MENCAKVDTRDRKEIWRSGGRLQIGEGVRVAGPGLQACSACAGDYENPERTTWTADDLAAASDEEKGTSAGDAEEFSDSEE